MELITIVKKLLIRLTCAALAAALFDALLPEGKNGGGLSRGARKTVMLAVILAVLAP